MKNLMRGQKYKLRRFFFYSIVKRLRVLKYRGQNIKLEESLNYENQGFLGRKKIGENFQRSNLRMFFKLKDKNFQNV